MIQKSKYSTVSNLYFRTERLGQNGIAEILDHPFFVNDQWTWETIRQSMACYCITVIDSILNLSVSKCYLVSSMSHLRMVLGK